MSVKESLPKKLQNLRERRGLSQDELAQKLDVTRVSISNYERGLRMPDAEVVARLAQEMGVTTDYLLGLSEYESYENAVMSKEVPLSNEALSFLLSNEWPTNTLIDFFLRSPLAKDFFEQLEYSASDRLWLDDDVDTNLLVEWDNTPEKTSSFDDVLSVIRTGHLSKTFDFLKKISEAAYQDWKKQGVSCWGVGEDDGSA